MGIAFGDKTEFQFLSYWRSVALLPVLTTQGLKEGFKNRISVSKFLKECGTAAGTQEGLKNTNKQTLTVCGGVALFLFSHICFGSVAAARGACVVVTTATNQPDAASSKQPAAQCGVAAGVMGQER